MLAHVVRSTSRRGRRLLALALVLPTLAVLGLSGAPAAVAVVPDCASAGYTVTGLGGPNFYIDSSDAAMRSAYTGYRFTNETGDPASDLYVSLSQFTGGSVALATGQRAAQRLGDLAPTDEQSLFWYLTASGATASAQAHVITLYRHDPSLPTAVALCTTGGGFASVATTLSASANKVTGITLDGGAPRLGSTFTLTITGTTGTIGQGISGDANSFWMTPAVTAGWPAAAFRLLSTTITMSPDGTAPDQTWYDQLRLTGLGSSSRGYTATYTFRAVGFTSTAATVQPVQQITSGTQVKHTGSYSVSLPAIAPPVNDLTMSVANAPTRLDSAGGDVTYTATVTGTTGAQLDGFDVTLPADATVVPGSLTWAGQPVGDPVLADGRLRVSQPFTLPDGGGELALQVHHGPTPGARTVVVQGLVGPSAIGTTASVLDGSNAAGATTAVNRAPVAHDLAVDADADGDASVPLPDLATDPDGDPLTISAVSAPDATVSVVAGAIEYAGSPGPAGEPVSFTVDDGRGANSSGTVTVLPAGSTPARQPQSLTASAPASVPVGDTVAITASASSGLAPAFATTTPTVCTVDGAGVVTGVAAGACEIEVSQLGDPTYEAAPATTVDLAVTAATADPAAQAIVVDPSVPGSTRVDEGVTLSVSTTSGLAPLFTSSTPEVCTVDGDGTVTPVRSGTCTILVDQPGDASTAPAAQERVELDVTPLAQTISGDLATSALVGTTTAATAAATSGLPVTWSSLTPTTCSIDEDGTVHALLAGECRVRARQPGDDRHAAATPLELVVTVSAPPVPPVDQTIALTLPPQVLAGPQPLLVTPVATSGLPVAVELVDGPCVLADGGLVADRVGTCTIEASQPGNASYGPAASVRAVVRVVRPSDDAVALPAGTTSPRRLGLLANDPAGLTVVGIGAAAHGQARLGPDAVSYLPGTGFRGTDRFTYTVRDDLGRTAIAEVVVTVANAAPSITTADLEQVAGTTRTVPLAVADPNGDDLRVTVLAAPAGVRAVVRGRRLVVTPAVTVSGDLRIVLRVQDTAGGSTTTVVRDRASPAPVATATRFLTSDGTRVTWDASSTDDARYEVLVAGAVRCRTARRSCRLPRIVGPATELTVRVAGADRTRSTQRRSTTDGAHRVLMATVYFAPGADELTPAQTRSLRRVSARIIALGFRTADLDGYTDSDGSRAYNVGLSHRRTETVARLLDAQDIDSRQSWHGMDDPAATNGTVHGKSANRRVELYVGF